MKGYEGLVGRGTRSITATTGRIHSIETFGTLDGPGIRCVLFFQGCPLRCKFCQNRDTWDPREGREIGLEELAGEVLAYRGYYDSSGGGVTATGGDPLLQASFVGALFRRLKAEGIHTALDTSGYGSLTENVRELLRATDLVLLDLKQLDDTIHRDLTGVSNRSVLEFARYLAARDRPLWIRHVIVPGYTANAESAAATAGFVAELGSAVKRVELIPYHRLGVHKWEALGKQYPLAGTNPPTAEETAAVAAEFRRLGLPVVV